MRPEQRVSPAPTGLRILIVSAALYGLLFLLWRGAIVWSERASPIDSTMESCLGVAEPGRLRAIDSARRQLRAMIVEREIPGLSVAVGIDGRLVWSEGFGAADRERDLRVCPETRFRIHSVAKTITAATLARLVEEGRVSFDDTVGLHLPDYPSPGRSITLEQLASHRGGIRAYHDDLEAISEERYRTAAESLEKFMGDPLLFAPGSDYAYSSYGFVLLSAALEAATGDSFPALLRNRVFEPLGMSDSLAEASGEVPSHRRAAFYDHTTPYVFDGTVQRSPIIDYSSKWASGGILSTSEDLVKFGIAHTPPHHEGFLGRKTLEALFAARTRELPFLSQGLGWLSLRDHRLRKAYLHFGAGSGGTSALFIYPKRRVAVAVLCNLGHARFPFNRLMRAFNPFVAGPIWPWAGLAGALLILLLAAQRRWVGHPPESPSNE